MSLTIMGSRHNPGKGVPSVQGKLECTSECRWAKHASVALSSTFLGNIKLLQHCATLCGNPFRIQDDIGRNVLHVAASCGHLELIYWLLARRKVKVNLQDWESKWTPLHRSVFYGQLGASALLMKVNSHRSYQSYAFKVYPLCHVFCHVVWRKPQYH